MSTMRRQSSRIAAFLQADIRPMFCWPRSASTARSQVWLGLPNGRFQSGGSLRITAATARWWSNCGELRAICPKSRKRLSVTRWESGRHPVVASSDFHVRHVASIWFTQDLKSGAENGAERAENRVSGSGAMSEHSGKRNGRAMSAHTPNMSLI